MGSVAVPRKFAGEAKPVRGKKRVLRKRIVVQRRAPVQQRPTLKVVPETPQPTFVGTGFESAMALSKTMYEAADRNGVAVRDFVRAVDKSGGVMTWAAAFCTALRPKVFKMSVHEGIEVQEGVSFAAQLRREVLARFADLDATGDKASTAAGVDAVCTVFEKMAEVHRSAVAYKREASMRFKAKIELNQDGACTKYHDDMVDLRLVTTLVGDGTVLADNTCVKWREYDKTDGYLPDGVTEENYNAAVRAFNKRVVTGGEIELAPGDLGVMKGGKKTRRPCLHRAPWTADVGTDKPRFLLTLERMDRATLSESYEMEREMEEMAAYSSDESH